MTAQFRYPTTTPRHCSHKHEAPAPTDARAAQQSRHFVFEKLQGLRSISAPTFYATCSLSPRLELEANLIADHPRFPPSLFLPLP